MRSICTLIIVGYVCFAGLAVYAQSPNADVLESIRQSLTTEGVGSADALSDRMEEMINPTAPPPPTPEEQAPSIEIPIIPSAIEVPEVNQGIAEVIDTLGRYRPRLKINFAEFPLLSFASANRIENALPSQGEIASDAMIQRIKDRFGLSHLHLSLIGRKAILSGTAETEHQRDMIAIMLRFEPGIDTVQNDMTLSPKTHPQ